MLQNIAMKKGNPDRLSGLVTAYARLNSEALQDAQRDKVPFFEMIREGILAITGDFRRQRSLRDFLSDFADLRGEEQWRERLSTETDLPDGTTLKDLLQHLGDPDKLEAIPVPSQIVRFHSEEELLESEGDIFFLGTFGNINNAHLTLSSFPILYQGLYREAEHQKVKEEIDTLLREIERGL